MEKYKSGFAALIGRPNVGKSTLMNALVGQKIAITSNRPQTTRNRIRGICTTQEGQIVFIDTPGMHKARNKLGEYMVLAAERTLNGVDAVLWLVEPDDRVGAGDAHIARLIKNADAPVFLVINKIDSVKKTDILKCIDAYSACADFAEIVPVSALKGENLSDLLQTILNYLPEGPKYFDEDEATDQPERAIAAEMIREKALRNLRDEVPHGIAVSIEGMKERKGGRLMDIDATIVCEKESHKGIVIGRQGAMLKKIGVEARRDIEDLLGCQVNLKLWVKVKKDWRNSDYMIKNFGYDDRR